MVADPDQRPRDVLQRLLVGFVGERGQETSGPGVTEVRQPDGGLRPLPSRHRVRRREPREPVRAAGVGHAEQDVHAVVPGFVLACVGGGHRREEQVTTSAMCGLG